MSVDLLIRDADIVSPREVWRGCVAIKDGIIVALGQEGYMPEAVEVIDGQDRYLIPGVVDIHVHFRDPGMTHKEDFTTGSMAAAAGGVTTIFDMPNVIPSVVDVESFEARRAIAEEQSYVNFGLYAFLMEGGQKHIDALVEAGVAGFKWAMTLTDEPWALTRDYAPLDNDGALEAFRLVANHGYNVGLHAEDVAIVKRLKEELKAAGRTDYRAHLDSRPAYVEVAALHRAMLLAEMTGCHLHVHHLSSKAGLELIKRRRNGGLSVSSEVCPPWFSFNADDYEEMGALIKVTPAIKEKEDAEALWEGLVEGAVECYATDHAPHTREEKLERDWHDALPGANGVETSVPLMLDWVNKGDISIERFVAVACENPARIYGLYPRKGVIALGADADLVLLDMDKEWTISNEELYSKNKLTPFDGRRVRGMPAITMVNGKIVARDRQIVGQPNGKLVNPKQAW